MGWIDVVPRFISVWDAINYWGYTVPIPTRLKEYAKFQCEWPLCPVLRREEANKYILSQHYITKDEGSVG